MRTRTILGVLVGLLVFTCSHRAEATFHLWQISQVYSSSSGTVQYVDFVLPFTFDDESFLTGHQLSAGLNSNSMLFGSNLPSVPVTGQHFLVATPGFAAIAGVTPDYTFPVAPFFNRNGDTLNYAFIDSFTFPALPLDGVNARDECARQLCWTSRFRAGAGTCDMGFVATRGGRPLGRGSTPPVLRRALPHPAIQALCGIAGCASHSPKNNRLAQYRDSSRLGLWTFATGRP